VIPTATPAAIPGSIGLERGEIIGKIN